MFKTTMPTLKPLAIPIGLSSYGVDMSATAASLTGVGRRNKNNRNASDSSNQ